MSDNKENIESDESSDNLDNTIRNRLLAMIPGEIIRFDRQARWRPAWDVEMRVNGELRRIHVRAEKGKNYIGPLSLKQEAAVHGVLEKYHIAVPHVYGMMDDPVAIVMDLIPGQINLATAANDKARESIRSQYVEMLARMHAIPADEFAALGLAVPETAADIALNLYRPCEEIYRDRMAGQPLAVMDFIWQWLLRNVPEHRHRKGFISADSGQFLFEGDQLTGLIDFEVGYVGDPLAEFAGMRLRDKAEPLGDLNTLMDQYQQLTNDALDKKTVEYHTAGFCAVNGFLLWPLAIDPDIDDDYVAYLSFSVATTRWSINAIAEVIGVELEEVSDPEEVTPLFFPAASAHLVKNIPRLKSDDPRAIYELGKLDSLARYIERCNHYGQAIQTANLADVSALLKEQISSPEQGERRLAEFVKNAGPEHDQDLIRYFHRWLMRHNFLLKGAGSSAWGVGENLQQIHER